MKKLFGKPHRNWWFRNRAAALQTVIKTCSLLPGHPTEIFLFRNPFITAKLHTASISCHMFVQMNISSFTCVPAPITLICSSIARNIECLFDDFVRQVFHKSVLNKNTWPEIVNVFLLNAVSTYSVDKNNKHLTYPVQRSLDTLVAILDKLVNVLCAVLLVVAYSLQTEVAITTLGYYSALFPFLCVLFRFVLFVIIWLSVIMCGANVCGIELRLISNIFMRPSSIDSQCISSAIIGFFIRKQKLAEDQEKLNCRNEFFFLRNFSVHKYQFKCTFFILLLFRFQIISLHNNYTPHIQSAMSNLTLPFLYSINWKKFRSGMCMLDILFFFHLKRFLKIHLQINSTYTIFLVFVHLDARTGRLQLFCLVFNMCSVSTHRSVIKVCFSWIKRTWSAFV